MYNNCFVQYTLQSLFFEVTTTALKIHCSCVGTCSGNINFPGWIMRPCILKCSVVISERDPIRTLVNRSCTEISLVNHPAFGYTSTDTPRKTRLITHSCSKSKVVCRGHSEWYQGPPGPPSRMPSLRNIICEVQRHPQSDYGVLPSIYCTRSMWEPRKSGDK